MAEAFSCQPLTADAWIWFQVRKYWNLGGQIDNGKGFSLRKRISPVNIILPMLHTYLQLHAELSRRTNAGSLEAFRSNDFTGIRAHWIEKELPLSHISESLPSMG
jgi:hypothetical protein